MLQVWNSAGDAQLALQQAVWLRSKSSLQTILFNNMQDSELLVGWSSQDLLLPSFFIFLSLRSMDNCQAQTWSPSLSVWDDFPLQQEWRWNSSQLVWHWHCCCPVLCWVARGWEIDVQASVWCKALAASPHNCKIPQQGDQFPVALHCGCLCDTDGCQFWSLLMKTSDLLLCRWQMLKHVEKPLLWMMSPQLAFW